MQKTEPDLYSDENAPKAGVPCSASKTFYVAFELFTSL